MPYTWTFSSLTSIRKIMDGVLPIQNSLVAYDLLLLLASHHFEEKQLTVKQLYSSLPHSYTAIRRHYNRLIEKGYLTHSDDPFDARIKYVCVSDGFVEILTAFSDAINSVFKTPPPKKADHLALNPIEKCRFKRHHQHRMNN